MTGSKLTPMVMQRDAQTHTRVRLMRIAFCNSIRDWNSIIKPNRFNQLRSDYVNYKGKSSTDGRSVSTLISMFSSTCNSCINDEVSAMGERRDETWSMVFKIRTIGQYPALYGKFHGKFRPLHCSITIYLLKFKCLNNKQNPATYFVFSQQVEYAAHASSLLQCVTSSLGVQTSLSSPKSWMRRMNMVGLQLWAPSSSRPRVVDFPALKPHTSMHLSTVSSAISRYVVHLPPARRQQIETGAHLTFVTLRYANLRSKKFVASHAARAVLLSDVWPDYGSNKLAIYQAFISSTSQLEPFRTLANLLRSSLVQQATIGRFCRKGDRETLIPNSIH